MALDPSVFDRRDPMYDPKPGQDNSMSLGTIGSVIGGIAGAIYGGPAGAKVGMSAGGAVGGVGDSMFASDKPKSRNEPSPGNINQLLQMLQSRKKPTGIEDGTVGDLLDNRKMAPYGDYEIKGFA